MNYLKIVAMRYFYLFSFLFFSYSLLAQSIISQQTAINEDDSTPDSSAILDINSSDKGLLSPRMTTVQRAAIAGPADGLIVYDTDTNTFWYFDTDEWVEMKSKLAIENLDLISPEIIGGLGIGSVPRSIKVRENYAYIADSGGGDLKAVDVSNPTNPKLKGNILIGTGVNSVEVVDNIAFVLDHDWEDLSIIDISNPSSMQFISRFQLGTQPISLDVQGDYVYVVDSGSDDLKIIDKSYLALPTVTGSIGIGPSPVSVVVQGQYAYVVDNNSDDLKVIYIGNPSSPTLRGSVDLGSFPRSVAVKGSYVYVTDVETEDLKVVSVSNPYSPAIVSSIPVGPNPISVAIHGERAYVVDYESDELRVFDISNPVLPTLHSSISINSNPTALDVKSDYAYVVNAGSDDLKVIDIAPDYYLAMDKDGNTRVVDSWRTYEDNIIFTNGKVGIGINNPIHKLHVDGRQLIQDTRPRLHMATYDGDGITLEYNENDIDFRIQYREDNGNDFVKTLMSMDTDGNLYFKDLPFGDYGNMQYNDSNGQFYYDNSSRRYKENITDFETDFSIILQAEPKKYTRPGNPNRWEIGYIAEEMQDLGLEDLVRLDEEGLAKDFNYRKMVLYLNEVIKDQQKMIEKLSSNQVQLQSQLTELRSFVEIENEK